MNVVVTQTAINASVSDQNISTSLTQTPISVSATISNVSASLTQTQINSSVQQGSGVSISLYQTPINVTVSSGGGGISDAPFDSLLYGRRNGAWANITGTGGGSSLPVADTQTIIMGSVDPTKLLRFEVDGFSAGVTRVLTPPNQNILLAGQNFANTFTVNQIVNSHAAIGPTATIDFSIFGTNTSATLVVTETFTNASSTDDLENMAISAALVANPSANASQTYYYGLSFGTFSETGNAQPILSLNGVSGFCYHFADGDITEQTGILGNMGNYGSGDIAKARGQYVYADTYGAGTVAELWGQHLDIWIGGVATTTYGIQVSINDDGGSSTTAYGIKIENVAVGATNYAIYTGVGDVSFGDNLFLRVIKSGATQGGAGAAAGEVWKTNGHATLPNNVLMIGV